jgi:hypothetical protein
MGEALTPTSVFTIEDARAADLIAGKNGHTWKKYARNMLFARALTNGARWHCADVFGGPVYTPEEMGAAVDGEGEVIDIKRLPPEPESPKELPPAPQDDEGWQIDTHTRVTLFGLCAELEKLGIKAEQWRAEMFNRTGKHSRRELTGPNAAKVMGEFAKWIAELKESQVESAGETREDAQRQIAGLIRSLRDEWHVDMATIKAEMVRLTGKDKRADLTFEESENVRNAFALWVERCEADEREAVQVERDEREAIEQESEVAF